MSVCEVLESMTEKMILVLDIGAAYTKVGFGGDFAPRAIIPTVVKCKKTGRTRKIYDYDDEGDLYDLLVEFLHQIYFRYALFSPKDKQVIVVESLLCPTLFRETLARVLFSHYEISSLLLLPSHLVTLATLAINTALVLDVGYTEAVAIPIVHGSPLLHAWQALPLGACAIHNNIKSLLSSDNVGVQNIDESVLEDIKVRCCFVTKRERAERLIYNQKDDFKPAPKVEYPHKGTRILNVSGKLRETAFEVLYEEDNDHQCISTMVLDVLSKVDIDSRVPLAENIVLIGGTVMAPGFKARLSDELYRQLNNERYGKFKKITKFMFHTPPSKDNYTAWLGGAIYGATDFVQMKSVSKERYFEENRLPDWTNMKDLIKSI